MIAALLLLTGTPAFAQQADVSVEMIPGVPPGPRPPPAEVDARARELGRSLRCPVCQGSNITDSPSETAKAMFERTRQLLEAGYSEEQIVEYFVDKYGEFILLDPQGGGLNTLLFIGPGLALGLGLALAIRALTGFRREDDEDGPSIAPVHVDLDKLDDYERRLLAELNDEGTER